MASNISDTALEGAFDLIHDLLITRMDGGVPELILPTESNGLPQVVVYRDPPATPSALPAPLLFALNGLEPPYWLQAMDAVLDVEGSAAHNEIIAYDQAGHAVCIDLDADVLADCGRLDLSVTASGASTSGRPGW